jgi:hypothetical protein
MKHERETNIGTTFLNTKQRKIKLVEKLPTMVELKRVTFLRCTHGSIWALDTQEEASA